MSVRGAPELGEGCRCRDRLTNKNPFAGARILVVEDEPEILSFIARVLRLEGATVVSASTGEEALTHLQNGEVFHLVTVDLGLPDMSGWDVLDALRRLPSPLCYCRVAILSARTADGSQGRAAGLGVAFVAKPIGARDLVERLRPLVSGSAAGDV